MAAEMMEPQDGLVTRRELIKSGAAAGVLATLNSFAALAQGSEGQEAAIMKFTPELVKSKFMEWIKANPQGTASMMRPWAGPQHMYDIPRRQKFVQHAKEFMFGSEQNFDIGTTLYENPNRPSLGVAQLGPKVIDAIKKQGDQALVMQAEGYLQRLLDTHNKLYSVYKSNGNVLGAKRIFDGSMIAFLAEYGERIPPEGRLGQGGARSLEQSVIDEALAVAKLNDQMSKLFSEFLTFAQDALR